MEGLGVIEAGKAPGATPGRALYAGSGGDSLPAWLAHFEGVRLDIDPNHDPDIFADMRDLGDIGPFEVVYCAHALEHLYPHEVGKTLGEFYRVLAEGGRVVVMVPDLEDARPTEDVLFVSPEGPITGLDLMYGLRKRLHDMPYMAHHTGFTSSTLKAALERAGFKGVVTQRLGCYNLIGGGIK